MKRLATGFAAAAGACSLLPLAGWIADVPVLAGLGYSDLPIWPWTAIAYFMLSLGFLALIAGEPRIANYLWIVPALIAAIALAEHLTGLDPGFDRLLFGDAVSTRIAAHPGRPGVGPSSTVVLLLLSGYASQRERWMRHELGSLFASGALALGASAVMLILLSSAEDRGPLPFNSLPGAISAMLLAASIIAWNIEFGWMRLLSREREFRPERVLLPLLLLLPLFPTLLAALIVPASQRLPLAGQIAIVTGNILIIGLVAYGAMTRLARGQAAASELTQALDNANVALTTLDGEILHWSRGCERLYGWTAKEALGRRKYELLGSRSKGLAAPDLKRHEQELVETRHDGREITVIERIQRIEASGRDPVLALSMSDISQTAAVLAALQASEDRLAEAAAIQELGVFEWDPRTEAMHWSPGTEQRLGFAPGDLGTAAALAERMMPEDREEISQTITKAIAEQSHKFRFRFRFREPNGNVRAVEGSSRAFYDAEGHLVRSVGAISDVTEREEREAALRQREAQLRSVIETVPDAIVGVNDDGVIREFSPAAEAMWGYHAADVLGTRLETLTPEAERKRYWSAIYRAIKQRDERILGRLMTGIGLAADGREFPIEYRVGLALIDGEAFYTVFFRDISQRVAAEAKLGQLNTELAHVARQTAMSELAADMAHELNQPLSAIANFLASARILIDRDGDRGQIAEMIKMSVDQTQRAGQIIRRLRDFTTRGEVEMRPEPVSQTVRDAAELVFVGTGGLHIRVTYALDPEVKTMLADRIQVQQVVVNLLRNARDILETVPPDQREIIIGSRMIEDDMVEISVTDSGPGIPQAILDEIFNRFTSTKGSGAGMGIGLSISKRIIEAHGGILSAGNRPEGGAVFKFTLPTVGEDGAE
ncbi:PAS domain S-box protein [Sphingomonas sp.]|uniref:PAS domain-containing sensor histidine kinase n=1 Tax=Sphingomonas sp. TaxID=28214 RepID=UPI001AFFBFF0|nr:PAS domain S-box protein [Sphingomonas sp.]MBO9714905.1 PAS domain S-box protein [Sphingomonas sp.]